MNEKSELTAGTVTITPSRPLSVTELRTISASCPATKHALSTGECEVCHRSVVSAEPVPADLVPCRVLSRADSARYLGVSISTFDKIVHREKLPSVRYRGVRGRWYDRERLDALIDGARSMPQTMPARKSKYGLW